MADQRYYEAQEEDLLQSLSVPQYAGAEDADAFDEGQYRELQEKALAQHGSVEGGESHGLEQVPEDVKRVSSAIWVCRGADGPFSDE